MREQKCLKRNFSFRCIFDFDFTTDIACRPAIGEVSAMNDAIPQDLSTLLERFISRSDTTLAAANRIEVLLEDAFPNDDVVRDRVVDLALYRPGGGEFLFDETEMRSRLGRLLDYLTQ